MMQKQRKLGKAKFRVKNMKKCFVIVLCALMLQFPIRAQGTGEVKLPILMYHQISEDWRKWNDYVVSVDEFESDMDFLKENGFQTISVQQLLDWYNGEFEMPEKPVMITFDDGFESTLTYAEPILTGHGFCAVVAVIGSVCDKFSYEDEVGHDWSHMSWEETVEMAQRGVIEVQCHTWDMHELSPRRGCGKIKWESAEEYRRILEKDLSEFLTQSMNYGLSLVPTIAYPYGEYCRDTTEIVKDLGFRGAFTCDQKINILTGDREELYHLARYNRPHGWNGQKILYILQENC